MAEPLEKSIDLLTRLQTLLFAASAALLLLGASPDRAPRLERARAVLQLLPSVREGSPGAPLLAAADREYHALVRELADTVEAVTGPLRPDFPAPRVSPGPARAGEEDGLEVDLTPPPMTASLRQEVLLLQTVREHLYPLPSPDTLARVLRAARRRSPCGSCYLLHNIDVDTISDHVEHVWLLVPVDSAGLATGEETASGPLRLKAGGEASWQSDALAERLMGAVFPPPAGPLVAPWREFGVLRSSPPEPDTLAAVLRWWEALLVEWPDFARDYAGLPREQAVARLESALASENRTLSLLGMTLDERLAIVGGPLVLALLMLYQLLVVRHARSLWGGDPTVTRYPFPPLFPGAIGIGASLAGSLVPVAALGVFTFRVLTREGVVQRPAGTSQWAGLLLSLACAALAAATVVAIRDLARPASAHAASGRSANEGSPASDPEDT